MEDQKESSQLLPPGTLQSESSAGVANLPQTFKVYKTRWYILTLYTAIGLVCNMQWNTWGPISEPCKILFGWGNWQVLFLTSWAAISLILSAGPSTWLMDMKGLRSSVASCVFLLTTGKVFHVIPSSDPLTRTILLNIGQCITMLSCPVSLGAPPSISASWFPPNERTTATAILTLVPYMGVGIAFVVGPNMVTPIVKTVYSTNVRSNLTNHTIYDLETMSRDLTNYLAVQLGITAFLLVCVLMYFPDKPPLPPCGTSNTKQYSYQKSIKELLTDRSYLYLVAIFSVSYGVYFGWMAVLSLAVAPFGVDEGLAGWLGMAATIAGIFSGVCLARFLDYVKSQTKSVLIGLFLGTTVSQLIFSLTCSNVIPYFKTVLFSSILLSGFFFNGTTPLLFEMAVETVYPVAEGVTAIFLLVIAYAIYLIFMISFMFPSMKVAWMNWATVIFNGGCVPALLFYKTNFKRLEMDANQGHI